MAKDFNSCSYMEYHSANYSGSFWKVDLGSSQTISQVVYYNRNANNDRATSYTLTLLDAAGGTVCSCNSFTSDLIQDLSLLAGIVCIW